jgi:hypothetical protein
MNDRTKNYKHQPQAPATVTIHPHDNLPTGSRGIFIPDLSTPVGADKVTVIGSGTAAPGTEAKTVITAGSTWDDQMYKVEVLKALGFTLRSTARWYHPVLGEDFEHNWMWFDLETDSVTSIVPKLYRTGWVYGQRDIRMKFKKVLDI